MDLVAEESIYVAGHGILCILQITVLLIFIIKTSRNKYYVIQKLGLSSVSLYTASTFILLCHHIFTLALQDEASQTILNGQIFRASGYLLVKFAEWNMLLIFLSRLHYTFNQTGLQISKKSKTFLYTLLGLVIINILIIIASMAIGFHFNGYWGLLYAGACIWCISYVILCITLVKRFIIRMDRIMISRYERSQTREVSEIVSSSNPNMCVVTSNPNPAKSTTSELQQEHDEVTSPSINYSEEIVIDYELVQIEIRYALLVSICIISSLVTLIMELGLIMFSPPHQVDHYTNMAFLLVSLDIFINSLCLCLLYDKDKSSVIYDKVCTICHSQCRSWRIRYIMNQQGLSDDNTSVQFKNLMTKE